MSSGKRSLQKSGDASLMATAMGLVVSLAMVGWIAWIVLAEGLTAFWPHPVVEVRLQDGSAYLGEQRGQHVSVSTQPDGSTIEQPQIRLKIGNRDIYGHDFIWLKTDEITAQSFPQSAVTIERREYGNFYGFIERVGEEAVADSSAAGLFTLMEKSHRQALENQAAIDKLQAQLNRLLDPLNHLQHQIALAQNDLRAEGSSDSPELQELQRRATEEEERITPEYSRLSTRLQELQNRDRSLSLVMRTVGGDHEEMRLSGIVRFYRPNAMSWGARLWEYAGKLWEFIAADPRESNTEGGVFPAIFGTVLMVLLMSIAAVPFGVMAALYLHEYARQGTVTRFIRLSVNNLAGVPSIVFGVFGLGFFVYIVGGSIDQLFFSDNLPNPTFGTGGILWASLTLALLTLPVVVVATEEGLMAVPRANKEGALALGATRWQMIRKVVLPNAMPGILTGLILAISRGAGEVAPLMITGVVKLAPSLALDGTFPFFHLDRKFMHLGFHIYDVGFQSPNVEAAKPMVYSTALLLIILVVGLNLLAIFLRNRLRKRFKGATF